MPGLSPIRMTRVAARVRELPWGLALTAATAGAIVFWVGGIFPGPAEEFPYYAPLGAVVAMSSTVVGSVRVSIQRIISIWLGSAIAGHSGVPHVESRDGGTGDRRGTLAVNLRWLGDMGTWVPTAALFVLIIGPRIPSRS